MTPDLGRLRAAMATLLVASVLLFVIGILVERGAGSSGSPHVEATSPPVTASASPHVEGSGGASGEAGESHAPEASAVAGEAGDGTGHTETGSHEAILGIDPEAPPLVAVAVILSLLAAFLIWRDGRRIIVVGAIVVAVGFAALDLLEVSHQVREGTIVVAIIAGLVAVGHLLAATFGVAILRRPETL